MRSESKQIFITRLSGIALYLRVAIVSPIRAILSLIRFVVVDTQYIYSMQQKQYWRMRISLLYIGPHACLASMSGNCSTYSRDFIVDTVRSSRYTVSLRYATKTILMDAYLASIYRAPVLRGELS